MTWWRMTTCCGNQEKRPSAAAFDGHKGSERKEEEGLPHVCVRASECDMRAGLYAVCVYIITLPILSDPVSAVLFQFTFSLF